MAKSKSKPKQRLSDRAALKRLPVRILRARYDAATITDENRRHFAVADGLSPDALANPETRRRLRNWTRYEVRNNSYAKGIRDTIANDTVGTGPQLQMQTGVVAVDDAIEQDFTDWAKEIRLAEKLRTMRAARADSGECFGLLATNPGLTSDVKLDVRLVEAEMVTSPDAEFDSEVTESDGIEYDGWGNPRAYWILRRHPGSNLFAFADDMDRWPARSVLHYFRPDRPQQRRGVPDFTPAVQLFAELRRFCAATIAAAETAADFAAVMETEGSPDESLDTSAAEDGTLDEFALSRRLMTVLPKGGKLNQIRAEHPATTYEMFVDAKLAEIARCVQVPFSIAGLNSAKSNLSARYLDSELYAHSIGIDRADLGDLLDRILDAFLTEWILINDEFGDAIEGIQRFFHAWFWPSLGQHADPAKVASARAANLASGLTTIPREYSLDGIDWVGAQEAAAKSLGISVREYQELLRKQIFSAAAKAEADAAADEPEPDEDEPENDDETDDEEVEAVDDLRKRRARHSRQRKGRTKNAHAGGNGHA